MAERERRSGHARRPSLASTVAGRQHQAQDVECPSLLERVGEVGGAEGAAVASLKACWPAHTAVATDCMRCPLSCVGGR